jgi:peroxiredoxin
MPNASKSRLHELEERFAELAQSLPDTPEKQALSLLHAILLESRRVDQAASGQRASAEGDGSHGPNGHTVTFEQIAYLYKTAPAMQAPAQTHGLPVGTRAPDFVLPDANGHLVTLADLLRGGQNVLLVFYPLDWSPGCSDQLNLYQSEMPEFERYHTRPVGLSVDSLYSHGAWSAVRGLSFPLLSDFNPRGAVAAHYQVMRDDGFSDRALFLVDPSGTIRYVHVAPHLHMVPDVYELFEELEKLGAPPAAPAG